MKIKETVLWPTKIWEIDDVLVYLIRLADNLDIDLIEAVTKKMIINRIKYPVEMVRGDSRKYSEY